MESNKYQQIVIFKETGTIPETCDNKSNFRRLCSMFEIGPVTQYEKLYFRKLKSKTEQEKGT